MRWLRACCAVGKPACICHRRGARRQSGLARRFAHDDIDCVQASPRERTRETALPIAVAVGRRLELVDALDEIDFGEWTGLPFEHLRNDPRWRFWNAERDRAQAPGGERMVDVRERVIAHLDALRTLYPESRIVVVTHAEIIRLALLDALRMPLGAYGRIEISPASVTVLHRSAECTRIVALNDAAAA